MTPWNYPLLMAAWKMAPILAAGNTLVIKPSEQTPLTTLKFAELVADILPAGVLNVVTGYGPVVGARLAEHPDIAMIALTGSVRSGKAVARAAAESLKRVHLELGGKAPVVIFPDADLAAAATALRAAGYWNSGQECGAACRVLVHESVADEFVELLVDEVSSMVVGEPGAGDDVEIGPLISKAHFDRVTGYLERAESAGLRAAVGGGPIEGAGYFVAPTVLVDVPEGAEARQGGDLRPGRHRGDVHRGGRGRDPRELRALRPVGLGVDERRPAQPRRRRRGWTPARSGSTPTSCSRTRCPGAGSRAPATAATCRSTRWTTTPAPST